VNDRTSDDALQLLKESYLEVRAPASIAAAAGEQFAASDRSNRRWHPGWVLASLLLAAVLIPTSFDQPIRYAASDSPTLPNRDYAFPSLSAIDLPPPGVFSVQRPNTEIQVPRLTPNPTTYSPTYTNDEAYL
jgi:hypothetical protein